MVLTYLHLGSWNSNWFHDFSWNMPNMPFAYRLLLGFPIKNSGTSNNLNNGYEWISMHSGWIYHDSLNDSWFISWNIRTFKMDDLGIHPWLRKPPIESGWIIVTSCRDVSGMIAKRKGNHHGNLSYVRVVNRYISAIIPIWDGESSLKHVQTNGCHWCDLDLV